MSTPATVECCPRFDPEPWDGKEIRWKNLKQVWRLFRDETAFDDYIRTETDAFLKGDEAGSVKR